MKRIEAVRKSGTRGSRIVIVLVMLCFTFGALVSHPRTSAGQATPVAASATASNQVCYEVFVRSFYDSNGDGIGDLRGLTEKLDYLNDGNSNTVSDLGVSCLWLMPIFSSPSYHGYDVDDYYTIEPDYGTLDDFLSFLREAHGRGLKVLLDLPLNHVSAKQWWFLDAMLDPSSPWRNWFIWSSTDPGFAGPWGEKVWHKSPVRDEYYYGVFNGGMPDLNYRNPQVTEAAKEIADFWLSLGVDGFRLDAIKHLIEDGQEQENTPETHAWLKDFESYVQGAYPESLTIGEIFGAGAFLLSPYYEPDQLDSYFQFEIAGQALGAALSENGSSLAYTVEDQLTKNPGELFATFLTNHDQTRTMTQLAGDIEAAKLAAAALLTLPGMPFIYYGEEIGMRGEKPDERIRTPMQWSPEGGFTTGTPWEEPQNDAGWVNVEAQDRDPESLLNWYRTLILLRQSHVALNSGDFSPLQSSIGSVTAFLRQSPGETVLVMINYGSEEATRPVLTGPELAGQAFGVATLLGGATFSGVTVDETGAFTFNDGRLVMPPKSVWIFELTAP